MARPSKSRSARKPTRAYVPLLVMGAGLVVLAAAVASGLPMPSAGRPAELPAPPTEDTLPDIPRVSLAEALAAYEDGSAVFVDVRDAAAYAESHVPGALSIPLGELGGRLAELSPSDWIITYCT